MDVEYRIALLAPAPAPARLDALLAAQDPSAVGELDARGQVWRLNTILSTKDVIALLAEAGCPTPASQVVLLPSVCCGGCSG
jgi:hypothetical protein